MTTRTIFCSVAVLVLLGAGTACDSNLETSSPSTTASSDERTTTTDEITTTAQDSSGSDGSDSSGSDGSDMTLPGGITIPDNISIPDDMTIPEDVKKDVEEALGAAGDCANIVVDYTAMASAALAGLDNIDFEKIRSDMKEAAPSDVDGAIDTVVDGFNEMREKGIIDGSDVMSDPEFDAASDTVNEWMKNSCGG